MNFSRLKKPAPPSSAPSNDVKEVEVIPPGVELKSSEPTDRTQAKTANALSVFDGNALSTAGMLAVISKSQERATDFMIFPIIRVKDGVYQIPDVEGEIADKLPQGKKPISGVFLGYRLIVTAWPKKYDAKATETPRPVFACAIPANDVEAAEVATAACKKYQFTKGAEKGRFDYNAETGEGSGHPRPTVEILVWLQDVGLAVIRNNDGYAGMARTIESLASALPDGQLKPTPMTFGIVTTTVKTAAFSWDEYHIKSQPIDLRAADGQALGKGYGEWKSAAMQDEELIASFTKWVGCQDLPMDQATADKLSLATR